MITSFAIGTGWSLLFILIAPPILGSHAIVYTEAAAAWLQGGDPWSVGPPLVKFSGPPPMLLPFAPLTLLPTEALRWLSVIGTGVLAVWSVRRLKLPLYWVLFPPLSGSVLLGHPEVLVLALLVIGGAGRGWAALSGLAAVIKPYAGFALLAERRWRAIAVAAAVVLASAPFLPWSRFINELPQISGNLVRQNAGDSTFGNPLLMVAAFLALASLGLRRALWLATPLLWPAAQPGYKTLSIPAMSPLIAACWALPIPGLTLTGVILEAIAIQVGRRRTLPRWLAAGIGDGARATIPNTAGEPA